MGAAVVLVLVAMPTLHRTVVPVVVMSVVVAVKVLVLLRRVSVGVAVPFGQVQDDPDAKESSGDDRGEVAASVSERPRSRHADERRERKDRPRTRRAHPSLREQVEAKTEPIARGPAHEQTERLQRTGKRLAQREGERRAQAGP